MAIGVLIEFRGAGMRAKYEKTVKIMLKRKRNRLADWPAKGCLAHIAGPVPGGWRVVDVWSSKAAFARFGKKLTPTLKKVGIKPPKLKVFPLARFIKT